ncbi:MAG TPA: hypothetical protein VFR18_04940 [Terriglobia bacterium]|nr:hypothetical protein [Terriglobia bacterium]
MRRRSRMGLFLACCLLVAVPAFSQANDSKDWQAIQDQKDPKKKAELLDAFIKKYPTSSRRPGADTELIDLWTKAQESGKILAFAEAYKKQPPSPDPAAKAKIYSEGMLAAYAARDAAKAAEFGQAAIEADPNHFPSLYMMAAAKLPNPPKALDYAQKALSLPRPQNLSPEAYIKQTARLHSDLALALITLRNFSEARDHLEAVLKADPKNQEAQFRHGFASVNMMGEAAKAAQDANLEMLKASTEQKTAEIDAAMKKQDFAQRAALELRDVALDSLAKAMALTGPYTEQAKPIFEGLYNNKYKSLDGADKLIAEKKAELGL